MRLFEALDDPRSHFILYATESADVLRGPAYRKILDNPSPWTRRIMPKFGPFDRALGEQVLKLGNGFGSHVAIWRIRLAGPAVDLASLAESLRGFVGHDGLVSLRVFAVDRGTTERHSEEKTMRQGGEGAFDLLLCAETIAERETREAEKQITGMLDRLFPDMEGADSSCRRMIYGEAAHEGPAQ